MDQQENSLIKPITWNICCCASSLIGYVIGITYILIKPERYKGPGRFITRIVLLMFIIGILELLLRVSEFFIISVKSENTYIFLIQGYLLLFTEYTNGFLITLITLSLFFAIVLDISVLEIESREMLSYLIILILTIISVVLTGKKRIDFDTHKIYFDNDLKYYSREAMSIAEINKNDMFVYITNFILLLNSGLYIFTFKKSISKNGNQSIQKNKIHYISTMLCYYIIYFLKWFFFHNSILYNEH